MIEQRIVTMELKSDSDLVLARQRARRISELLGFERQDQTRLATAVSEIARNAIRYAKGGRIKFAIQSNARTALHISITDSGGGIANLQDVLRGRYRSNTGLGMGIISARKLVDEFVISTGEDGTSVELIKHVPLSSAAPDIRAIAEELVREAPDDVFSEVQRQNQELLLVLDMIQKERAEIERLNEELSETNRGVLALYAELDEKAESLRRASEEKTRFLSNMSHEFRTPLNSIVSLSQILLAETDGPLNDEQRKQLGFIRSSSLSLAEMVNDLLDIARIEAGKTLIKPSQFTLSDFLAALRGMFRPQFAQAGIELVFENAPTQKLYTDEGKLSQIVRNFISNALKFTERGTVRVESSLTDKLLSVSVTDTGIGISEENLEKIFLEFVQIENPLQKRSKGSGLGLALSRKLAQLLGGTISVVSMPGEGSRFSVTVPRVFGETTELSARGVGEAPESTFAESDAGRVRVLVVDDDPAARYVLRKMLPPSWLVEEAESGSDGLALLRTGAPLHAMFLDVVMPHMDGFEVLSTIRLDEALRSTPVILFTSKQLSETELERAEAANAAVLAKSGASEESVRKMIELARDAIR